MKPLLIGIGIVAVWIGVMNLWPQEDPRLANACCVFKMLQQRLEK